MVTSVPLHLPVLPHLSFSVQELLSSHATVVPAGMSTGVVLQPVAGQARWRLQVSDTGIGLPSDFEARRRLSLGMQLVSDLVRQLGAELEVGAGPAAVFTVSFLPQEADAPRVFAPTV